MEESGSGKVEGGLEGRIVEVDAIGEFKRLTLGGEEEIC